MDECTVTPPPPSPPRTPPLNFVCYYQWLNGLFSNAGQYINLIVNKQTIVLLTSVHMLPASSSIVCWAYAVQGTSKSVLAQPPAQLVLTLLLLQPEWSSNTWQFLIKFVRFPSVLFRLRLLSFLLLHIPYLFRLSSRNYPWIPVKFFVLVWPWPSSQCTFLNLAGFFFLGLTPGLVPAVHVVPV